MDVLTIAMFAALCALMAANLILVLRKKDGPGIPSGLEHRLNSLETTFGRFDPMIREEFVRNREENAKAAREDRTELSLQQERMKLAIGEQLKEIRAENEKKLDEMKKTVDENLKETVEKRFDESFTLISGQLKQVHEGLGEMKKMTDGVNSLNRVLTDVKRRGSMGEVQLGSILEDILSPNQFEKQKQIISGSREAVDYVVKLPDKNRAGEDLLLPIDSKFPTEDYLRLLDAREGGMTGNDLEPFSKSFESSIKKYAKDISGKYINIPVTTDFAIMFVPSEALYSEVVCRPMLFEELQRTYKITVVGPTNLAAFLSSLKMGFNTLAIEKRSSEVWDLLNEIKKEFGTFGETVEKVKNKLEAATNEIGRVETRSRVINRKLRDVKEDNGKSGQTVLQVSAGKVDGYYEEE
ncbi:MAG: DNA recombination protein RmuC [Candidatus Methanoplasma sp.]|jgi:DNA recombination protein RmuC|nr:DNA recombination protein RmuC [Candidatus Methanoplasma sp.]